MGYMRPVAPTGISSWTTHKRRNPPSKEPGTDYYCPIGTPVHAAGDGRIVAMGTSLSPATGFYYAADLDDGRSYRDMHLLKHLKRVGDRVRRGEIVALSGATGYGVQDWSGNPATGGAHVHRSLFRVPYFQIDGFSNTLDPELYSDETPPAFASDGSTPFDPTLPREWDDMATREEVKAAMREVLAEKALGATSIVPASDGGIYLVSGVTGKRVRIGHPSHIALIQRASRNNNNDTMHTAELDIVSGYVAAINPPVTAQVDTDALATLIGGFMDDGRDADEIAAAVRDALRSTVGEVKFSTPDA